ncbi:Uncharacterized aarF domain-containing protein kinase 5 [Harpegnathos saltator]|uniref:Uncharacterized aarF domain-containing protein kinase 5 n=1 Tax=Harpegnathos saltator TaxID=610380 RepID=E2BG69_HARSA|nr:Uncharacterized aarF domain-containing protein kinase 5 [Harpegnathos saltator]
MLQTGLLRSASAKRLKYVGTGVALLSVSYILLPSNKKKVVRSVAGSLIRFARSFKISATVSMDYLIAPLMGHTYTEIHRRSANRIVQGCLRNGGIYIKLGQGFAAVNHVLPKEYIESLSTLQDKCLTREKDELEEIFLQDFGKKPEEMLRKIESEPVAAASLAQDVFEALAKELDFEREGKNGEQCAKDLKKYEYAYVPKIYWDLSSKRVLTTEWIDGVKVTDVEGIKTMGLNLSDVDKKLITLMGEQIFHTGFVHADPHPGNVFVRKGKDNKAQIVLLDHGLYQYLPEKIRCILCNFWESMVLKNDCSLKIYANDLNVKDHIMLAEILTQAPYRISLTLRLNNTTMDEYMKNQAQEHFDKITETLKLMPKHILLVIR